MSSATSSARQTARLRSSTAGVALALASMPIFGWAEEPSKDLFVAPPPVSGRRLTSPETITSADVLARIRLIHAHLETIRAYVGRPVPPTPLLRVEGAHPREVFIQLYGLRHRSHLLGFDYLDLPIPITPAPEPTSSPARNLEILNEVLETILRVRHRLGIQGAVAEPFEAPNTPASDVFNAVVSASKVLDALLDTKIDDSRVFSVITLAFNIASLISSHATEQFRPEEPPFIPNQTPGDVYQVLLRCFGEIARIAERHELQILRFTIEPELIPHATTNHVMELSVLTVSELLYLHRNLVGSEPNMHAYFGGRKFPSHAVQRAQFLERILKTIAVPKAIEP